jgi:hypothetical protein
MTIDGELPSGPADAQVDPTDEFEAFPTDAVFDVQTRERLEGSGFLIVTGDGASIADLTEAGVMREFGQETLSRLERKDPATFTRPGRRGEYAFHSQREHFYLPESAGKDLAKQQDVLREYEAQLRAQLPNTRASMGEAVDYAWILKSSGLTIAGLQARLRKEKPRLIRTATPYGTFDTLTVGYFGHEVATGNDSIRFGSKELVIAPLILPGGE